MDVTRNSRRSVCYWRVFAGDTTLYIRQFHRAGSVLTLLSCFGLGSITSLVSKLDAQAVTQIGRQHVERHLPTGTASLATYLTTEAPTVVRHTLRSLLLAVHREVGTPRQRSVREDECLSPVPLQDDQVAAEASDGELYTGALAQRDDLDLARRDLQLFA